MSLLFEPRLAKLFVIEGKEDVVPFVIRVKGLKAVKARTAYFIAIDSSLSMDGAKIFFAKEAIIQMLKHLDPDDYISIYSFCGKVTKVVSMEKIKNSDIIAKLVADIKLGGGTDIYRVLQYMYRDILSLASSSEKSNNAEVPKDVKIILVTDGNPTIGVKDENKILDIAERLGKHSSISLIVGIGDDYNEKLLMDIASKTKGFFEHLKDPASIPNLVEKMVSKYKALSAKNTKIFIRSAPGIGIYVYNKPAYNVKGGVEIEVGDIYGNEIVNVVGEFIIPPQKPGPVFLASMTANYIDNNDKFMETEIAMLTIPCLRPIITESLEVDEKVFKEVNMVRIASILAKNLDGEISVN
ncbi:MAG: VWA domain-containing protein, partial [Ignisphaera sp.]